MGNLRLLNTPKEKQKRNREWVNWDVVQGYINKLNMNLTEFAAAVKQSATTISNWKMEGRAPAWVPLACEGLIRRNRANENHRYFVVSELRGAVLTRTRSFENPGTARIGGKEYYLIPMEED